MTTLSTGKFNIIPSDTPQFSTGMGMNENITPSTGSPIISTRQQEINTFNQSDTANINLGDGLVLNKDFSGDNPRFQLGYPHTPNDQDSSTFIPLQDSNLLKQTIEKNPEIFNLKSGALSNVRDYASNFLKGLAYSIIDTPNNGKAFENLGYSKPPTKEEIYPSVADSNPFTAILTAVAAVIAAPVVLPAVAAAAGAIGAGVGTLVNAVGGAAGAVGNAVGGAAGAVGKAGGDLLKELETIGNKALEGKDATSLIKTKDLFSTVIGVGSQIVGANQRNDAANAQVAAYQAAAAAEMAAYERAQKLLGLGKDQAISDIQASALKAQGLITDTEEKVITTLNSTEKGAIGTINAHLERQQNEINSTESAMLKGLIDSGIIQKNTLTGANLSAIKTITGAQDAAFTYITGGSQAAIDAINSGADKSILDIVQGSEKASGALLQYNKQAIIEAATSRDKAVQAYKQTGDESSKILLEKTQQAYEQTVASLNQSVSTLDTSKKAAYDNIVKFSDQARQDINQFYNDAKSGLDPYTQLGERSALQNQYLSGILTPVEKADYESKFGGVQESPLYKYQVKEAELMLDRRQKALGKTFSGQGAQEFKTEIVDKIAAQEAQRQLDQSRANTTLGYNAAAQKSSLATQQGTALGNISQTQGTQLGNLEQTTGQNIANLQYQTGNTQAGLTSGLGTNLANIAQRTGENIASAETQYGTTAAGINQTLGSQLGNVFQSEGMNKANIEAARGTNVGTVSQQQGNTLGSLAQTTGNNIGTIQSQQGSNLANMEAANAALIANTQQGLGTQRANAIANAGTNIANLQSSTGTNIANTQSQLGTGSANLASGTGTQLSNINTNYGNNAATLEAQAGVNAANLMTGNAANLGQQSLTNSQTNPLNIGLNLMGYQQGLGSNYVPPSSGTLKTADQPKDLTMKWNAIKQAYEVA